MKIKETYSEFPVYEKYPRQFDPQPAYIELDFRGDGKLHCDYNAEIGNAIPKYLYNGEAIRFEISPYSHGYDINKLFKNKEFLEICESIIFAWKNDNDLENLEDKAQEIVDLNIYENEELFLNFMVEVKGEELGDELKELLPNIYSSYMQNWEEEGLEYEDKAHQFMYCAYGELVDDHHFEEKYGEFISPDDIQNLLLEYYKEQNNKGLTK